MTTKKRFNPNLQTPLSTKTAKTIIRQVKRWCINHSTIEIDYSRWYCGITNNPPKRKSQHKTKNASDPYAWNDWDAKNRRIAEAIETYFHNLGMKNSDSKGGSSFDSKNFYTYKKRPTWFD